MVLWQGQSDDATAIVLVRVVVTVQVEWKRQPVAMSAFGCYLSIQGIGRTRLKPRFRGSQRGPKATWKQKLRFVRHYLLKEALLRAQAEDAVYSVGCAMGSSVEVADLKLAKQADAHHLDSGEDEDTGDDEDGAVDIHDVL